MDYTFFAALTLGFLGSTHCIGMCGGIVGTLSNSLKTSGHQSENIQTLFYLTYNTGRIVSYTVAGAVAGLVGVTFYNVSPENGFSLGSFLSGVFLIAVGLYLTGIWAAFARIEGVGRSIWKFIQPLGQVFIPTRTPLQALGLGLVWGWLPCGLVYTALALAVFAGSPADGALFMLGFGLGTLPMLLVIGKSYERLENISRSSLIREIAGVLIILYGLFKVVLAF